MTEGFTATLGKVISPKTGNEIQCTKCSGKGHVTRSYTRTTTYIDVLDDKSNLEAWQMRMVLVGVSRDPGLLNDVPSLYSEQQEAEERLRLLDPAAPEEDRAVLKAQAKTPKDELTRRAQVAKQKAGAEEKADKGTELHELSELVDLGQELPHQISFRDTLDLHAYRCANEGFKIIHMEKLVVCDELKVGGTPDRVSEWRGVPAAADVVTWAGPENELYQDEDGVWRFKKTLVAPDGTEYKAGDGTRLITDLKTGTVEYGGLKMAMQLAIYANSLLYDPETGARSPLEGIDRKWGIIMNVPAGSGHGALYWADLTLGWEAVQVAGSVRRMRNQGRRALTLLSRPMV